MVEIIPYEPKFYVDLPRLADVGSAWRGIDRILYDIVARFNIPQRSALEFGVEFGYSTSALANVFDKVIGVDTFIGDLHTGFKDNHFLETSAKLRPWPNIQLAECDYHDWITEDDEQYDLIHIDMVHLYEDTYVCGWWACQRAKVTIFHDTEKFPEVMYAVRDIAEDAGRKFYNYRPFCGLGILVNE